MCLNIRWSPCVKHAISIPSSMQLTKTVYRHSQQLVQGIQVKFIVVRILNVLHNKGFRRQLMNSLPIPTAGGPSFLDQQPRVQVDHMRSRVGYSLSH